MKSQKPTHTPGPWKAHNTAILSVGDPNCDSYCGDIRIAGIPDVLDPEQMANAQLIAAAPELLESLQTLINLHEGITDGGDGITEQDWNLAKDAIAKATGENL